MTSRVPLMYSADSTWRGVLSSSSVKSPALRSVTGFPDFCSTTVTRTLVEAAMGAAHVANNRQATGSLTQISLIHQLSTQHGHSLPGEHDAVAVQPAAHDAPARGGLVGHEVLFSKAGGPERDQAGVRRAGHRIFIYAGCRSEKARNEIETVGLRARRHDDSAHRNLAQQREIGFDAAQHSFRRHFDQIIELVAAHVLWRDAQRFGQPDRWFGLLLGLRRKIHFDPIAPLVGGKQPAARVEPRLLPRLQMARFPKRMRAGERGVAA